MPAIKILERETLSEKNYKLEEIRFSYSTTDEKTVENSIEIYQRPSACTILLIDRHRRKVLLTEQVRLPIYLNGGQEKLIESCAGLIDEGEDPENTIKREVKEETGYSIGQVRKIFSLYSSPGGNTELIHYFIGDYSPADKTSEGGGKEGEGEHITLVEWSFEEAVENLKTNKVSDAKTFILLQYAILERIL